MNLSNYLMAGFQILFVETLEIKRCVNSIEVDQFFGEELTRKVIWNSMEGDNSKNYVNDSFGILNSIKEYPELTILILENFELQLVDDNSLCQLLLNISEQIKQERKMIVIVGSDFSKIPRILEKVITKLEFDLPTEDDFKLLIENIMKQPEIVAAGIETDLTVAATCKGLSLIEAENIISKSIIEYERLDKKVILEMKRSMIKKTGFMDIIEPETIEDLAGLENLKEVLFLRKEAWEPGSIKPKMRSIFLVGLPGTGKSLTAKVMASIFNCPLIMVDIGSCKGSLVGQTEKNLRMVTSTIDAFGMCIVFLDEINYSIGGSDQTRDGGTSLGIVGHLLTWTQESKGEKIIAATANDLIGIPPAFLRAGRFDDIFFLDFPNFEERKEIVKIMNRKHNSNLPEDDNFIRKLEEWTGAEIESLAKKIHFFSLEKSMTTVPLVSKVNPEAIKRMKLFSKGVEIANKIEEPIHEQMARTLTLGKKEEAFKLKKKLILKKDK